MGELHTFSGRELTAWDEANQLPSLQELYDRLDADTINTTTIDTLIASGQLLWVPDVRFASVLNERGEIQIGKDIYRYEQKVAHIVPAGREDLLREQHWNAPEVRNVKLEFNFITEDNRPVVTGPDPINGGQTSYRQGNFYGQIEKFQPYANTGQKMPKTWNGRPTRMKYLQWNAYWIAYASTGIRTKYQYKSRYADWQPNQASWLYCGGWVAYTNVVGTLHFASGKDENWNDNGVEKTLFWTSALPIQLVQSESRHLAEYKGLTADERI